MKTNDLQDKLAVILGATNGIGREVSRTLVKHGCDVVLVARNTNNLHRLQTELQSNRISATTFTADVTDSSQMKALAENIHHSHHGFDFLINVAGLSLQEKKGAYSEKNFAALIAANLSYVYTSMMILVHPLMHECGSVVNISSIRARTGTPSYSSGYAAAKAGVINLGKSFALELADRKIRVNTVAPGATFPTGMSKDWSVEMREDIAKSIPLGRLACPADIANAVYFFVSDLSIYITGQTLDVNGGTWMN